MSKYNFDFINDLKVCEENINHIPLKLRDEEYKREFILFLTEHLNDDAKKYSIPLEMYVDSELNKYISILENIEFDEEPQTENDESLKDPPSLEVDQNYLIFQESLSNFLDHRNNQTGSLIVNLFLENPQIFSDYLDQYIIDENLNCNFSEIQNDILNFCKNHNLLSYDKILYLKKFQFSYIYSKKNSLRDAH